jgi:Effector-associated domain 7
MDSYFNFQQLRQRIETGFDLQDLRTLCFDLDIVYDELSGDRLSTKIIALVTHMRKTGQMVRLIKALETIRPELEWSKWTSGKTANLPVSSPSSLSSNQNNPFGRTGQIQKLENYLVRQPINDAVIVELQKGVSLSITGPSQTGKSSLLWHITQYGSK